MSFEFSGRQIADNIRILQPSPIPHLHAFLQNGKMFFVGHNSPIVINLAVPDVQLKANEPNFCDVGWS